MRNKRVLMVANVASMIKQFNMENIRILKELGFLVDVACNFEKGSTISDQAVAELRKQLESNDIRCFQVDFSRSAFKFHKHVKAYKTVKRLMDNESYWSAPSLCTNQ
jgi:hypothetical protein